jgi:hypothetical protein
MQGSDALAIAMAVGAGVAFFLGEQALSSADDMRALYWLAIGVVALQACVKIAKPGSRA